MKEYLIVIWFLFISIVLSGQTLELEKQYLNDLIQSGKINQDEAKKIGTSWHNMLNELGGYPELPYNPKTEQIEFIHIDTFTDISKRIIFDRVKEWIAINYGSINEVLHYENFNTGKIIVKGSTKYYIDDIVNNFWGDPKSVVRSLLQYHTCIYTIVDNKLKSEFTNLEYESESGGYANVNYYVPVSKINYSIWQLYPVTISEEETWISRLSTLKMTNERIDFLGKSIKEYIESSSIDYDF
jgi:hypothetical protein